MTEIVTVPKAILQRLEQVQTLSSQGRQADAGAALVQALVEIARSQPELGALLMATRLGYRQISFDHEVRTTNSSMTDKRILGVSYGRHVTTATTVTRTTRTIRLH